VLWGANQGKGTRGPEEERTDNQKRAKKICGEKGLGRRLSLKEEGEEVPGRNSDAKKVLTKGKREIYCPLRKGKGSRKKDLLKRKGRESIKRRSKVDRSIQKGQ